MDKFKKLIEAGSSVRGAIRECLGMSDSRFALKYGLPRPSTTEAFNGTKDASDKLIAALVTEIGGTEAEWREHLPRVRTRPRRRVAV